MGNGFHQRIPVVHPGFAKHGEFFQLAATIGDFLGEALVFGGGGLDALAVAFDFAAAAGDDFAQLTEAAVHRGPLFVKGLLGALLDGEGGAEFTEEFGGIGFVPGGGVHGGFQLHGLILAAFQFFFGAGAAGDGFLHLAEKGVLALGQLRLLPGEAFELAGKLLQFPGDQSELAGKGAASDAAHLENFALLVELDPV